MSELVRKISTMLSQSDDWECDRYRLTHKPTGIALWVSNGSFFLDIDGYDGSIGLIERHWLWFTKVRPLIKKMRVAKALELIEKITQV